MAKPLRPKRGTTAQNEAFVGLYSEITVDTGKHTIRVHDGVTAGGHALATEAELVTVQSEANSAQATANNAASVASMAQTTANNAASVASAAQNTANTAQSTASSAAAAASSADTKAGQRVLMNGSRGTLAGYNTPASSSSAVTINGSSNDDTIVTAAVNVTIGNGSSGQTWTKTVALQNALATVTLGGSWKWVGGSAPTIKANSILVVKWCGSFGLANLIAGE